MLIKTLPIGQVKAGPEDGLADGEFLVYPSTFTRSADAYGDVVAKGAFLDDIARWKASGDVLPGLYGHRMDDPDFFVASALDMGEDDHGWWVKGVFDLDSPKGPQVYRLVKGRRLRQLSFAYDVLESGRAKGADGEVVNELRKLRVYEFSFVPVGANQDTSVVAVKAICDGLDGRRLSSDSTSALHAARDAIDSVLASLDAQDGKSAPAGGTVHEQASEPAQDVDEQVPEANDEEPETAKSEELEALKSPDAQASSVDLWATQLTILALG